MKTTSIYFETFPAISITVLPIPMKERLLQEPVRDWLNPYIIQEIPIRLLSGLCSEQDVLKLSEAEAIQLLEQDFVSAIQEEQRRPHNYIPKDIDVEAALEYYKYQRSAPLSPEDSIRYHGIRFERHSYLRFEPYDYIFPDPLQLDLHALLRGGLYAVDFLSVILRYDPELWSESQNLSFILQNWEDDQTEFRDILLP